MRRTTTSVGGVEDGYVPNIKGGIINTEVAYKTVVDEQSGALYLSNYGDTPNRHWTSGSDCIWAWWKFDASRSNSAYINDNLVIPRNLNIGGWLIKYI